MEDNSKIYIGLTTKTKIIIFLGNKKRDFYEVKKQNLKIL